MLNFWYSAPKPTPTPSSVPAPSVPKPTIFKTPLGDLPEGDVRVVESHNVIKAANVRRIVGAGGLANVRREGNKTIATHLASEYVRGKATLVVAERNETTVTDSNGQVIEYFAEEKFDAVRRAFLGIKVEQIDTFPVGMLRRMLKKFSTLDPTHSMSAENSEIDQMEEVELRMALKNVLETINLQYQG